LESIRQKTVTSNRYAGYFSFSTGTLLAALAVFETPRASQTGRWLLVAFLAAMALAFVFAGIALTKMAKSKT
jgi:hypothetical protein